MPESTTELTLERMFEAPSEAVFRAFTDADQLAAWFGPTGFSVVRDGLELDARVGGHQRFVMVSDTDPGLTSPVNATFTAVKKDELLAAEELVAAVPGQHDEFVLTLRLEFQDEGNRTRLRLRQGPYTREVADQARAGWESSFARLDAVLAG